MLLKLNMFLKRKMMLLMSSIQMIMIFMKKDSNNETIQEKQVNNDVGSNLKSPFEKIPKDGGKKKLNHLLHVFPYQRF